MLVLSAWLFTQLSMLELRKHQTTSPEQQPERRWRHLRVHLIWPSPHRTAVVEYIRVHTASIANRRSPRWLVGILCLVGLAVYQIHLSARCPELSGLPVYGGGRRINSVCVCLPAFLSTAHCCCHTSQARFRTGLLRSADEDSYTGQVPCLNALTRSSLST